MTGCRRSKIDHHDSVAYLGRISMRARSSSDDADAVATAPRAELASLGERTQCPF
jgi:hypothetical protein